jgi:hypothetical protein
MYSGYGAYDRPLAKRQVTQVSDAEQRMVCARGALGSD